MFFSDFPKILNSRLSQVSFSQEGAQGVFAEYAAVLLAVDGENMTQDDRQKAAFNVLQSACTGHQMNSDVYAAIDKKFDTNLKWLL